jgi:CTD small phosphatase-like protein 2
MSFRRIYKTPYSVQTKFKTRAFINSDTLTTIPASPLTEKPVEVTFMVNLEDLLIIEGNLSFIIEKFAFPSQVLSTLEDIWELTSENTLNNLYTLYRDERTRETIKYSMVLQAVGVSISHYFISEYSLNSDMSQLLKSIMFSIHQGFLIITKFVLSRVPSDNKNNWANRLRSIIKEKKLRKHHIDNTSYLDHYNILIVNNLKKMCRNFISSSEDQTVRSLKMALLQIIRNRSIPIMEARTLVETAFGVKREASEVYEKNIKFPFLPSGDKEFTLVLDLDETLVHYIDSQNQGKFLKRPFLDEFLKEMAESFEVVIFTAAVQNYADWILDDIDKNHFISHRLYRNHTIPAGNYFIKDLKQLGRDLAKVVIVDNVGENFQMQSDNGILIKSWYEDMNDTALPELAKFLMGIVENQVKDVRDYLKEMRQKMLTRTGV